MKLTFNNKREQVEYEIGVIKRTSLDPQFTLYLDGVLRDVAAPGADLVFLRRKLIENYDIYASRMNAGTVKVEPLFFKAVYGDMEAPEILDNETVPEEQVSVNELPYGNDVKSFYETVETQPANQPEPQAIPQPAPQFAQQPMPQAAPQYNQQMYSQPPVYAQAPAPSNAAKTAEYAIGAIVMSIVGSVFLLIGLVYLAVNYLDSFAQGMLMYVACFGLILISELVVRLKVPKLSSVFTAIGISGLYLSTVVNYRSLDNINLIAAALILGLVAILVCIFGYIRKSQIYSVIGFLAAFISSVAIGTDATGGEFLIITLGTLLISCLWLVFPVKQYYGVLATIMMVSEFFYVPFALSVRIKSVTSIDTTLYKMLFVAASWVIIEFVYFTFIRFTRMDGREKGGLQLANMIIMIVLSYIYSMISLVGFVDASSSGNSKLVFGIIVFLLYVLPGIAFTYITYKNNYYYAVTYFITLITTGILSSLCPGTAYFAAPVVVTFALVMRYVCGKNPGRKSYKIMDIIVQVFIMLMILMASADRRVETVDYFGMIVASLGAIAGLYFVSGYNTVVWILVMTALSLGSIKIFLPDEICAATSMGIVLIMIYVKNTFDRFKDKKNIIFNWFALVYDMLLLLGASSRDFSAQQIIVFSIAAIFGLAFVILIMNKEYGFPFAGKYIVIPTYLTYVCFLAPIESGFVRSIIIMAVAVVSVVIGFVLKEKPVRIYGLVLSIIICGKIAFVDFVSIGSTFSKMIMYILVGLLALAIGCIYLVLEARENKINKQITAQGYGNQQM